MLQINLRFLTAGMPKKNKNHSSELEQRVEERTKELQESEAILRGFIDGSMDAICIRDLDRRLILWNKAFARSVKANCGIDVQAGMRAEDYVPEEVFAQFDEQRKLLYPAIDGESTQVEYAFPCKGGKTRYFDVRWTPVSLGGEVFAVAEITRDITEQKIANDKLRHRDEIFKGYMESSTEAIWGFEIDPPMPMELSVDAQLDYLYDHARIAVANVAWARQAGYNSWEDMIGVRLDEIVPRSNPDNIAALRQLAEANYQLENFITHDITKQGELQIILNNHSAEIKNGHLIRTWGTHRDITEQEAARQELRNAERRYRTVADFTYDWEYWESPEGEMLYVSPSCERISGYEAKAFLDNSDLLEQIIDLEDVDQWTHHRHNASTRRGSTEIEFRIHTKEGEIRWIEHACQPVYDEDGEFLGIRASNRDITLRKHTDESLSKSREFNRAILVSMQDHIAVLDIGGNILSVNQSWLDFAMENDVSSMELVGEGVNYLNICQSVTEVPDKASQKAFHGIQQVLSGSQEYFELEYPCHSPSEERWFLMKVIPFKGEKGGVIVAHTNITVRKKAEDELKKKDKLLEDAQRIAHLGSWDWNILKNKLVWSDEVYQNFGLVPQEFGATFEAFIERIHPNDREKVKEAIDKVLNDPTSIYNIVHRIIKPDGSERIVRERGNVTFDPKGKATQMIGTVQDVTEIRIMEAETQKLRMEISHMDRIGTMGVLSAGIGHELNQPLAAILSNAQAALRFLGNDQPDINEVKEALLDIVLDDKRAGEIVHGIRNIMSKSDRTIEEVDFNETVESVKILIKSELLARNITLSDNLQNDIPKIFGNRIQIQQVILNLLMNAMDAVATNDTASRKIMISTRLDKNGRVILNVSDSGDGIKSDQLETIFDSFYTTKAGGLGVGLSICRSITEEYGGRIWAENIPQGGAAFFLELPPGERKDE
jgi:PAS domain S-box-containing protein